MPPPTTPSAVNRPLWDRLLDPLRTEAAMFRVLIGVVVVAALVIGLVLGLRAL
jgi:hypothetical protein